MRSALPDDESQIHQARFLPGAVVNGFFASVLSVVDSDIMRYVGGEVLNNPATRANQSRGGGLRIEPGGRVFDLKVCSTQAMAWLRRASIKAQRNFVLTRYRLRFTPTFTREQVWN